MRKTLMIATIFAVSAPLGACASYDEYGYDRNARQRERAVVGAAAGAAVGAAVGATVGGVSTGEGAAVGAVAGAIIGAATSNNDRRWYRNNRGECYYVNDRGDRIYDYGRRC